jgi:hypothetical protein
MKKIIYNRLIPFKGYVAINLFGIIFVRKEYKAIIENNYFKKSVLLNHELVHTAQYKELLYVFYLPLYLLNYFINLFVHLSFKKAYRNVCFEKEAYTKEYDDYYLERRHRFAWFSYILNSK